MSFVNYILKYRGTQLLGHFTDLLSVRPNLDSRVIGIGDQVWIFLKYDPGAMFFPQEIISSHMLRWSYGIVYVFGQNLPCFVGQ